MKKIELKKYMMFKDCKDMLKIGSNSLIKIKESNSFLKKLTYSQS